MDALTAEPAYRLVPKSSSPPPEAEPAYKLVPKSAAAAPPAAEPGYKLKEIKEEDIPAFGDRRSTGIFPTTALTRGVGSGSAEAADMFSSAWEGLKVATGAAEPDFTPRAPHGFERQVPDLQSIKPSWDDPLGTVDRAATYAGETVGSAAAQMAAPIVAGLVTGGPGAVVTSMAQNYGDVWDGFKQDKDIQKLVKEGKLSHQTAAQIAAVTGVFVGSLDALSINRVMKLTGLAEDKVKDAVVAQAKKALLRKALEGGTFEGITEAAQSFIAQVAEIGLGKPEDIEFIDRGWRLLNEGVAGLLGGTAATAGLETLNKNGAQQAPASTDQVAPELEPALDIEPAKPLPATNPNATPAPIQPGQGQGNTPAPVPGKVPSSPKREAGKTVVQPSTDPNQLTLPFGEEQLDLPLGNTAVIPDGELPQDQTAALNTNQTESKGIPEAGDQLTLDQSNLNDNLDQTIKAALSAQQAPVAAFGQALPEVPVAPELDAPQVPATEAPAAPVAAAEEQAALPPKDPRRKRVRMTKEEREAARAAMAAEQQAKLLAEKEDADNQVAAGLDDLEALYPADVSLAAAPVAQDALGPIPAAVEPMEPVVTPGAAPEPEYKLVPKAAAAAPAPAPTQAVVPAAPAIAPTVSDDPVETRKLGELTRQMEEHIYQGLELSADASIRQWPGLPELVRRVAERATRPAAGMKGVSPKEYLRKMVLPALGEVQRGYSIIKQRAAEAKAAEPTYEEIFEKRTERAVEQLQSGRPEERERTGKHKGKSADAVKKQTRTSWWRLEKKAKEQPEDKRDPDIQRMIKAKEERDLPANKFDKAVKTRVKAEIEAAQKSYTERVEREESDRIAQETAKAEAKEAELRALEEKAKPKKEPGRELQPVTTGTELTTGEEIVEAESEEIGAEESPKQKAHNREMAAVINAAISEFEVPPLAEQVKDNGKKVIKAFKARIQAALKKAGLSLADSIQFGKGVQDNGLPAPRRSDEENVAIFINRMKASIYAPLENVADFYSALAYLKDGNHQALSDMISEENVQFVEYDASRVTTSIADEVGDVSQTDMRKGVTHSMPIEGEQSASKPTSDEQIPTRIVHPKTMQVIEVGSYANMTGAEALRRANAGANASWGRIKAGYGLGRAIGIYDRGEFVRPPGPGLINVLRRLTVRQLTKLVGDIEVDFVSAEDINKFRTDEKRGLGGIYLNYNRNARASGHKPRIVINRDYYNSLDGQNQARLINHEMTHAATSYALMYNLRGTDAIVTKIRTSLEKQVRAMNNGDVPVTFANAFSNNAEFIADAFTRWDFQQLLAELAMPEDVAADINSIAREKGHKVTRWWDAFMRMVANALAPFARDGRLSYLEHIAQVTPEMTLSSRQQVQAVKDYGLERDAKAAALRSDVAAKIQAMRALRSQAWQDAMQQEQEDDPGGFDAMAIDLESMKQDVKHRVAALGDHAGAAFLWVQSTENIRRRAMASFQGAEQLLDDVIDLLESMNSTRKKYQRDATDAVSGLAKIFKTARADFIKAIDMVFDATKYQIDISEPLSHANNSHVSKKGVLDHHRRSAHNRLHPEFMKLPAAVRTPMIAAMNVLKKQEDMRISMLVENIVAAALRPKTDGGLGKTLPPGWDSRRLVQWVMNGGIDRKTGDPANPKPKDRTPDDELLHTALGGTIEQLKGSQGMREIKGMYVPLMRHGKYFFTARKPIATPAGARLESKGTDGVTFVFDKRDPNLSDAQNAKVNEKAVRDFQETSTDMMTVSSVWIDPRTGKVTEKTSSYADPNNPAVTIHPVQTYKAVVQDKYMEMDDNLTEIGKTRDSYVKQGFTVERDVALTNTHLHGASQLLPEHVNAMLRSVAQSFGSPSVKTAAQKNAEAVVISAYTRQLGGNRQQHRRLRRKNVGGQSKDFLKTIYNSSFAAAGHLAALEIGPKLQMAESKLQKFIDDPKQQGKGLTIYRQKVYAQLKDRLTSSQTRTESTRGSRFVNGIMSVSFVMNLASTAYSITNAISGQLNAFTMIAPEWGAPATIWAQTRALRDLNFLGIYWDGIVQMGREGFRNQWKTIPDNAPNYDDRVLAWAKKYRPGFVPVVLRMRELDFGASAGIEAPEVREVGKGKVATFVDRSAVVMRSIPEAIETVNRYVTALMAYDLAKNRGKWKQDRAVKYAVSKVEESQGGYAAENNPSYMSHAPLVGSGIKLTFQYKKYPLMYGQAYWGAVVDIVKGDKATRVLAAKRFLYLSAGSVALAGTHGMAMMELGKLFFLLAAALPGDDWDWEEFENGLQRYYARGIDWFIGDKSDAKFLAEMAAYGLTRGVGIETSARMGNAGAVLSRMPKSYELPDMAAWAFGMLVGAGGTGGAELMDIANNYDDMTIPGILKKAPLPKQISDAAAAYELATEGYKNKHGRKVDKKLSTTEAIIKATGFSPAREAQQYEAYGKGTRERAENKMEFDRQKIITRWTTADDFDKDAIWKKYIEPWNKEHPERGESITHDNLLRSRKSTRQHEMETEREDFEMMFDPL